MDPLSDLLRVVRLDGAYFFAVEAAEPWSVETVAAQELSPRILPTAEHLISYHILTRGHCFAGVRGEEQVELLPGRRDRLSPRRRARDVECARHRPADEQPCPRRYPDTVFVGKPGTSGASFVCGFLGCDRRPFNPLLAALPRRMHMRGMSNAWLGNYTRQLTEESHLGRPAPIRCSRDWPN
jgi:hypothetical protein